MDFFESLSVAFYLFQTLCLSPFSLKNHKMKCISKNIHRISSFSAMAVQVLQIILSLVFIQHIVKPDLPPTIKMLDTITMVLIQSTALLIFWESYHKRFVQMDFLQKINSIDFILEYKIGINPNYANRRKTNIIRLLRWMTIDVSIFITNFVLIYIFYPIAYRWWAILSVPAFIYSMRYYQITTFVDIINHRYYQINQFIGNLNSHDRNEDNFNVDLVKTLNNVRTIFQKYKSGRIYEKLNDLRRVCRLLGSANQSINDMFQYSIPLIIVNDFSQLLTNCFWVLRIFLENKSPLEHAIPPLLWAVWNFHHFISLSTCAHYAAQEV